MAEEQDRDDLEQDVPESEEQEEQEHEVIEKEKYESAVEELAKARKALSKANKEAEQRRHRLKSYEQLGDPDEINEIVRRQKEKEEKEAEHRGDTEKMLKAKEEKWKREVEEREQRLGQMQNSLHKYMVESQAASAIQELDGVPKLLMPHIKEHVKMTETDNGDWVVRVVDEDGDPKFNANGEYMSIRDLVSEMKEDDAFGLAFKSRAPSGAGTNPNKTTGTPKPRGKRSEMSKKEKEEFIEQHGFEEYQKLPV